jgi:elongation factor 2
MVAKPLNPELADAIEDGAIFKLDTKARIKELVSTYKWDKNHAQRIWDYGPEGEGANIIIDATKGV